MSKVARAESPAIVNPKILGGAPVFPGTRVPVKALFDYLEGGDSLDIFLDHFPTVSRESAIAVIRWAREITMELASKPDVSR